MFRLFGLIFIALGFSGSLSAGTSVSPNQLAIYADRPESELRFENTNNRAYDVTVALVPWYPEGAPRAAREGLEARDILVYPPVARVTPNSRQTFRILVRNTRVALPRYYHAKVVATPVAQNAKNQIVVGTTYEIPIYLLPSNAKSNVSFKVLREPGKRPVMQAYNSGTAPAQVKAVKWGASERIAHRFHIWPGQSLDRRLPGSGNPPLELELYGGGKVRESVY